MAKEFDKLIKTLKAFRVDLEASFKEGSSLMLTLSSEHFGYVWQRIKLKGVDSKGKPLKPYSTTPILVTQNSFNNKGAIKKLNAKLKKKQGASWLSVGKRPLILLEGGYKEVRALDNRETERVDYLRRGLRDPKSLINNTKSTARFDGNQLTFVLTALTPEHEKQLLGLIKRDGVDVWKTTEADKVILRNVIANNIATLAKSYFG